MHSFLLWLWRAGMGVCCVFSNLFGDTASLRRRCLKGSMDWIRFCMSNLLWDQFTTALGLTPMWKKPCGNEKDGGKGRGRCKQTAKGILGNSLSPSCPENNSLMSNHICTKCISHLSHSTVNTSVASAGRRTGSGVNQTYRHAMLFLAGLSLVTWKCIPTISLLQLVIPFDIRERAQTVIASFKLVKLNKT